MRARGIKPGFFKNEVLSELDPICRLLFIGLWCMADREGRLEDRPKRIKAELFPYDNIQTEKMLKQLHETGFINRYSAGREKYIEINKFKQHQHCHVKEPESNIPAPDKTGTSPVQEPGENVCNPLSCNPSTVICNPLSGLPITDAPGKPDAPPPLSPTGLALIWNENAPSQLSRVIIPLNGKRKEKAMTAIKTRPDPEFWVRTCCQIQEQPFLLGSNDRKWMANFDFLLTKYDQVAEGKYRSETRFSATTVHNLQVMKEIMDERGIE